MATANPVRSTTQLLKAYTARQLLPDTEQQEAAVEREFDRILNEQKRDPSFARIPSFYFKRPTTPVAVEADKTAREMFYKRRRDMLLDDEELRMVCDIISAHAVPSMSITERINYEKFVEAGRACPPSAAMFFQPSVFAKFPRDFKDTISVPDLLKYIQQRSSLEHNRIKLSLFDASGSGVLTEEMLERYVMQMVQELPALSMLQPKFHRFYVYIAVRKFMFVLDQTGKGKIPIKDVVSSAVFGEWLQLQAHPPRKDLPKNWFSGDNALRVYAMYVELDTSRNGMLSPQELILYGDGTMTHSAVRRIFQVVRTYDGELDFRAYLDLTLAVENKKLPQSIAYFFKLLDINEVGYLDAGTINYFYRDIAGRMVKAGYEAAGAADVKDEIFDMVKPADPLRITLKDLLSCGVGDTVCHMLLDVQGFVLYDHRESMAQAADDEGDSN